MLFYTGTAFPEEYRGRLFVAEHGADDFPERVGHRIGVAKLDPAGDTVVGYEVFAEGWLRPESGARWGRPVTLRQAADGALLVDDDHFGATYRVTYAPP